jgi:SPP1 family predicted phage head-tail adaptor
VARYSYATGKDQLTIAAGDLPHRIAILSPTKTGRDTYGTEQLNNPPLLRCWAAVEAVTGEERMSGPAVIAFTTHKVIIRNSNSRVTITPTMKVAFDQRIFEINWVADVLERDIRLVLYCTESTSPT